MPRDEFETLPFRENSGRDSAFLPAVAFCWSASRALVDPTAGKIRKKLSDVVIYRQGRIADRHSQRGGITFEPRTDGSRPAQLCQVTNVVYIPGLWVAVGGTIRGKLVHHDSLCTDLTRLPSLHAAARGSSEPPAACQGGCWPKNTTRYAAMITPSMLRQPIAVPMILSRSCSMISAPSSGFRGTCDQVRPETQRGPAQSPS